MISKDNIISRLNEDKYYFQDYSAEELDVPFDFLPDILINRAIEHYKQDNNEDALSNSKRALECQMDCLLYSFGYYSFSKKNKWNFPKKMEILAELDICTPKVLGKINLIRNKIEHDYKSPSPEFVDTAIDVSKLFLKYADKYWKKFRVDPWIGFDDTEELLIVNFDPSAGVFNIGYSDEIGLFANVKNQFSIKVEDNIYLDFLKKYLKIYDEW